MNEEYGKEQIFQKERRAQPLQRAEILVYHIKLAVAKLETWPWKFLSLSRRMSVGPYLGVRIPSVN